MMAINTNILKTYAPEARRAFIAAVKARAARFGITEQGSSPIREEGNVAIINEQPYPQSFAQQRRDLDQKIAIRGYASVMEEVAYTWFNRFAAIRYMELHDYLEDGVRVLSHPNGGSTPEIIEKAAQVDLPGLKRDQVIALKLDGTKDDELYRMLVVAQCNALHAAMPFLFEKIEDETELLLPDNLLHSESLVRQLVERIPEADWQHIEIIGWLYQFYISEKKDQVIGTVVKSEDIPAATQLFTPNWIVKYMVQNSLGAKWLATYPSSPLRTKMEYYIEPAAQSPDVQAQLKAETPEVLDPEALTFLDPASGSGHILVEAYNLFKEIYLERGYRLREIPRLILERNLFGLDIDDRAAQLSGFALLMRARADDRQILSDENPPRLNVHSIQESKGLTADQVAATLLPPPTRFNLVPADDLLPETRSQPVLSSTDRSAAERNTIADLIALFQEAKTIGSLISVPTPIVDALPALSGKLCIRNGDDLVDRASQGNMSALVAALVRQAELLGRRYDVVAANPPYMGSKGMNGRLKDFAQREYPDSKSDLFAMFMERCLLASVPGGLVAMINMQSWMFLSSYERLRTKLLASSTILSMFHLGERGFDSISGAVVSTTSFILQNMPQPSRVGEFFRLVKGGSEAEKSAAARTALKDPECGWRFRASAEDFYAIPGAPIAYWLSDKLRRTFQNDALESVATFRAGLQTGDNDRFLRLWHEVSRKDFAPGMVSREAAQESAKTWFPHNKGGGYRKWYGNNDYVINWRADGEDIKRKKAADLAIGAITANNSKCWNQEFYFRDGLTWSSLSSSDFSIRHNGAGFLFDTKGQMLFASKETDQPLLLGLLNSTVAAGLLAGISPTLDFNGGVVAKLPLPPAINVSDIVQSLVKISREDWDSSELSWDFSVLPIMAEARGNADLSDAYTGLRDRSRSLVKEMRQLEEENNQRFVEAYGLEGDVTTQVGVRDITIDRNSAYRYGHTKPQHELDELELADAMRDFISYAVGCMFGRYSLEKPGLILASQGETLQDYLTHVSNPSFMADADNVIPVMDDVWFDDDATDRFFEFLRVTFGDEKFAENLKFIEAAIGKDVRKYFKRDFYSDHLRRYKKRPIYWLFSSGKEKAFEALVYLHRYNEGTLARMRLEYVVPLQTQMAGRVQRLNDELQAGNLSSSETKKRNVQLEKLQKQQVELRRFEEELHHFADQRIKLDLDDGVKVNYGKFGNLLADVKAITGGKDDE